MIEGLKFKVPAAELRQHCTDRAAYHKTRAEQKSAEMPKLREALDALKNPGAAESTPESIAFANKALRSTGYHADPQDIVDKYEADIRDHRNKALLFGFYSEHFFDEDYTLMDRDLIHLEILGRN